MNRDGALSWATSPEAAAYGYEEIAEVGVSGGWRDAVLTGDGQGAVLAVPEINQFVTGVVRNGLH